MKSKLQKKQEIEQGNALATDAQSLVFVDFSKTPVKQVTQLKNSARALGATYRVVKKRLLKRVFTEKDIMVDPEQFNGQVATIFSPGDISEIGGVVYRFIKGLDKDTSFQMLGGYAAETKKFFSQEDMTRIGQLPSREVLLAQLMGMLQAPMRQLAYTLDQVAKKKQ